MAGRVRKHCAASVWISSICSWGWELEEGPFKGGGRGRRGEEGKTYKNKVKNDRAPRMIAFDEEDDGHYAGDEDAKCLHTVEAIFYAWEV